MKSGVAVKLTSGLVVQSQVYYDMIKKAELETDTK